MSVVILAVILAGACSPRELPAETVAAVKALPECRVASASVSQLRAVARGIIDADNARDLERVLDFYAEDAVLMPPGEGAVSGREAIRPRYERLFADFTPEIELSMEEACSVEAMGFVRGRNGGRLVSRTTDDVRELDDVFLMLLRREADGQWRISHLIWHRASREAAPDRE